MRALKYIVGICLLLSLQPSFAEKAKPRMVIFVGVDISGSFLRGPYYENAMRFLATYLHAHLNGYGGMEIPKELFVGSIGGDKPNEPKTLFPKQTFQDKSIDEIARKLAEIFPKNKENPFTDFNAFVAHVSNMAQAKNLALKPISIVLLTDGEPDLGGKKGDQRFRKIDLSKLENLSRNLTVRLLYTHPQAAESWQTKVKRQRVRVWAQDDKVMSTWNDPKIYLPGTAPKDQTKFFNWVMENVDFNVSAKRVD
jgi:hypothetical protein